MVIAWLVAALIAHPLHTTMTELTIDVPHHTVRATVRVFADDFGTAAKRSRSAEAYLSGALSIVDGGGRHVSLVSCGTRRTGDLMWICVEGSFVGAEQALRISNSLLCDLFVDQVNIVQVVSGSDRRSVLFTRGDSEKRAF